MGFGYFKPRETECIRSPRTVHGKTVETGDELPPWIALPAEVSRERTAIDWAAPVRQEAHEVGLGICGNRPGQPRKDPEEVLPPGW
ncbi:hypothetical protein ACFW6V_25625 [Streptomyces sp. NPDC058734]|uniref:hypothetical protein n=1 Tax=Streptomyces sp. NPDC058734 TaxID=3346615 RepID=UPI0036CDF557